MKIIRKYIHIIAVIFLVVICVGIAWLSGIWNRSARQPTQTLCVPEESADVLPPDSAPDTATPSEAVDKEAERDIEEEYEAWLAAHQRPDWMLSGKKSVKMEGGMDAAEDTEEEPYVPPTVMFASDLHYMSETTHDDGYAFWQMVENDDGKITQYSDEMVDALLEEAVRTRPAALVLCGDLTLNGERENHEKLAEKLAKVQEAGVPVVVIPGNHDINKPDAAVYFGRVSECAKTLEGADDFYEIYHAFGYDQSPNRDPASLSYVYPVDATHWLLMIDSCQYEDGNQVNGRIRPETLAWLRVHLQVAQENQIQVLPVAHHNLLSESRLYTTDCTIENHDELLALLEEYQVPLYISGHLHAQRIKKHKPEPGAADDAYGITEIVLSPYSIPDNQYGSLYWDQAGGEMEFTTVQVDVAAWAAACRTEDENLLNFRAYSQDYLRNVIRDQVMKELYLVPDELKEKMADLYAELYYQYCNGNAMAWSEVRTTSAYRLWERVYPDGEYTAGIAQMIRDVRTGQHTWCYDGRLTLPDQGNEME